MKRTCHHPNRQARRERALARFQIQSEAQFNEGRKPDGRNVGSYVDYLARKYEERNALHRR